VGCTGLSNFFTYKNADIFRYLCRMRIHGFLKSQGRDVNKSCVTQSHTRQLSHAAQQKNHEQIQGRQKKWQH
jgi:hypothetical protein